MVVTVKGEEARRVMTHVTDACCHCDRHTRLLPFTLGAKSIIIDVEQA